jgi:aldose 1-epimerase
VGYSASGEQWQISADGHEATVVEVGGGLRGYTVDGVPQILGYPPDAPAPSSAGAQLVPWPNRIRDGRYTFRGTERQLPLSDPARHNAGHGLLRWASWRCVEHVPDAVTVACTVPPQSGYPFRLAVSTRYSVSARGLAVEHEVTNTGVDDAPLGFGAHPYLYLVGSTVDDLVLHLPGATHRVVTDDRGLPVSREAVAGTPYDFSSPRRIGGLELDTAFAGVDGPVTLSTKDGRGVSLWRDEAFGWVQVFTSDSLAPPRWRASVAVEPMTCPADAFNSGVDLIVSAPGETWRGSWGISPLG